ncbi:MAG: serine/threonine protein kinase [Actinomycetia bacterium]|nr:serine/threonine protein kinase [Actinomycetes bacterium]
MQPWSTPAYEPLTAEDPQYIGGYRVVARLGAGGMGRVYLGTTQSGRRLAIKVVRPEFADDPEFRRRFEQEVMAAQRVQSLYTAPVIDADLKGEMPWLATAHVPGPSLAQAVAELGPLPADTVRALIAGIAEALQAIHRAGIVHRDLKPSNVLLAPDGPKVIDFGISRAADSTPLTRTGLRIGSPQYMAPEQANGLSATAAVDVFALGSVAYFAATGRTPFGEGPDATVLYRIVHNDPQLDGCPESLLPYVTACLAKDPAQRPPLPDLIAGLTGESVPTEQGWLPEAVMTRFDAYAAVPAPPTLLPPGAPPTQPGSPGTGPQYAPTPPPHGQTPMPGGIPAGIPVAKPRRTGRRLAIGAGVTAVVVVASVGAAFALKGGGQSGTPKNSTGKTSVAQQATNTPAPNGPSPTGPTPTDSPTTAAPSATSTAVPPNSVVNLVALLPVQHNYDANFNTGPEQIGTTNYLQSVRFTCQGQNYTSVVYNVAGFASLDGTIGVPNDATNAAGNTATIAFFANGSATQQLGPLITDAVGHPRKFHVDLKGSAQLKIACSATSDASHGGVNMDISLGNATLSP